MHPYIEKVYKQYFKDYDKIIIKNIYDYGNIINSCNTLIIVNSGINSLASAIKSNNPTPRIICYNPWSWFKKGEIKGFYNYPNVDYITAIHNFNIANKNRPKIIFNMC